MAKLTIQIVVQPDWKDAKVVGPIGVEEMSTTTDASMFGTAGQVPQCLDNNYAWTEDCPDNKKFLKVGEIHFTDMTADPSLFRVNSKMGWMEVGHTLERNM